MASIENGPEHPRPEDDQVVDNLIEREPQTTKVTDAQFIPNSTNEEYVPITQALDQAEEMWPGEKREFYDLAHLLRTRMADNTSPSTFDAIFWLLIEDIKSGKDDAGNPIQSRLCGYPEKTIDMMCGAWVDTFKDLLYSDWDQRPEKYR